MSKRSDCQLQTRQWGKHEMYLCEQCNIKTLDIEVTKTRCELRHDTTVPPSERQMARQRSQLYGPHGEPLRKPGRPIGVETPNQPEHVGGGWYETEGGERVQGFDNAVKAQNRERAHDQDRRPTDDSPRGPRSHDDTEGGHQ